MDRSIYSYYSHDQSSAASTWTIAHNLGRFPIVDVFIYDEANKLRKIIPEGITYVDNNTCVVTFTRSFSGKATVV